MKLTLITLTSGVNYTFFKVRSWCTHYKWFFFPFSNILIYLTIRGYNDKYADNMKKIEINKIISFWEKKLYESSYQNLAFTQNNDFNDISVAKI